MRRTTRTRDTRETNISVEVNLDGTGKHDLQVTPAFFSHMLATFSTHSLIDITMSASGDLTHHIIEDAALVLGQAMNEALGKRKDIARFGFAFTPMECSLARAAIDLAERPYAVVDLGFKGERIEKTATEDLVHFIRSFAFSMKIDLHVNIEYGENDHHRAEAAFKAIALAIRQAIAERGTEQLPQSTKGCL
ncbi:MAG: imidazoleglycerol-phosphate dehydratase [Candidatus Lokiarchaeota archaeon]|nr:imidazoleglycerol-phosphate dehydratase [Candidatus Lokiarchaeota archaeon]